MIFSSFLFLYLFLPLTILLYFATPRRFRNIVLLIASLVFYAWGAPQILAFLLVSCAADYWVSLYLAPGCAADRTRKRLLWGIVTANLGLLAYFKYANFFVEQANFTLAVFGVSPVIWTTVVLPIGISFLPFKR